MDYRGVKVGSLKVFVFCMEEHSWLILSYEICSKNMLRLGSRVFVSKKTPFVIVVLFESIFMSSYLTYAKKSRRTFLKVLGLRPFKIGFTEVNCTPNLI